MPPGAAGGDEQWPLIGSQGGVEPASAAHGGCSLRRLRALDDDIGRDAAIALVEELSRSSAEFAGLWRDHEVGSHGGGVKRIEHRTVGSLTFEYATFAVDEQPDLGLVVFTPATPADRERVEALVRG